MNKLFLFVLPLLVLSGGFGLSRTLNGNGGTYQQLWTGSSGNTSWSMEGGYMDVTDNKLIMNYTGGRAYGYSYRIYNATNSNNISITAKVTYEASAALLDLVGVSNVDRNKGCLFRCGSGTCYVRSENTTHSEQVGSIAIEKGVELNWTLERSQNATAQKCVLYRNGVVNITAQTIKPEAGSYTIFYIVYTNNAGNDAKISELWSYVESNDFTLTHPANTTFSNAVTNVTFKITGFYSTYNVTLNLNNNVTTILNVANNTDTIYGLNSLIGSNKLNLTYGFESITRYYSLSLMTINTDQYVNNTLENTPVIYNFTLGVNSLINKDTVNANLTWNGVTYQPDSRTNTSTTVTFSKTLNTPTLTTLFNSTLDTLWNYNYTYNAINYHASGTNKTLTYYQAWVGNCSTIGTPTLNLTLWNEAELNTEVIGQVNAFINITNADNYSIAWSGSSNYTICMYPAWLNTTFNSEITSGNTSAGYYTRKYFHTNTPLTNTTLNTRLFLLDSAGSTDGSMTFIVKYKDDTKVSNAIVQLEKTFLGYGVSHFVTMAGKTSSDGEASTYIDYLTTDYSITVSKDGSTLKHLLSRSFTTSDTPYTIIIDDDTSLPPTITGTPVLNVSWNNNTGILNLTINDGNTDLESTILTVYRVGAYNTTLECTRTILGVSGAAFCNLTTSMIGNDIFTYYVRVQEAGYEYVLYTESIDLVNRSDYGSDVPFALFALVGFIGLFGFKHSPQLGFLLMALGLGLGTIIFTPVSFFSMLPIIVLLVVLTVLFRGGR